MDISFRQARVEDLAFARNLYFETMRWIIERLFGWDQDREQENFAAFFNLAEVRIITSETRDVGWIQERSDIASIYLGGLYIVPAMQPHGIGSQVLNGLLARAKSQSKVVTLALVKINPALRLYQRHGFRITREDEYKFYIATDPSAGEAPCGDPR